MLKLNDTTAIVEVEKKKNKKKRKKWLVEV